MQLTRFDRWLREKYVYEVHIRTLSCPESIPIGIKKIESDENSSNRYKHLFVTSDNKLADQFIEELKLNSQMYTTQIVDRKSWYVPLIAPKNKSLTWWLFSTIVIACSIFTGLYFLKGLVEDFEFRKNCIEAFKLLTS
jgi:hypothetical protein